jgi:hypothetical protein
MNGIVDNVATRTTHTGSTANAPSPAPAPQRRGMSFMNLGTMGGLSRTPTSEVLSKAITALTEESKKLVEAPWKVSLIAVDNQKETNLSFSGIIVAVTREDQPRLGVAYHTLILEESSPPIPSKVETYRGLQFEIQYVTGDAYNSVYGAAVEDMVKKAFPNMALFPVDAQVVPRGFNYEDKEAIHSLTLNSQLPCYSALEVRDPTFQDIDLSLFEKDTTLAVKIGFNEPQVTDYVGLPMRRDVSITLTASSINRAPQSGQLNSQERSKVIAVAGGYIDPVWAPVEQNQYMYQPNMPNQKFAARFVMTSMENVAIMTVPAQLLALSTAFVLRENNNWYPYFSPRPIGSGRAVDLRDVGAINIEGNVFNEPSGFGTYVDTKKADFSQIELGKLLQMAFRPGMTFSLRVSECGADTWYNSVFKAAADGDLDAVMAILQAANTLTGGAFARHYNSNENPVMVNYDRVHLGYYVGDAGVKRDLSDIDYLAIMNMVGKADNTVGAAWSDTFFKIDQPAPLRMSARKKMIESVIHSEVTYTGMARLVTFQARFVDALSKACAEANLDIRTINPNVTGDFFSQRAQASFVNQAQVLPGSSGVFSQGYGGGNSNYQDPRGFTGNGRRW